MKKILFPLFVLITGLCSAEYAFPLENPYAATIVGEASVGRNPDVSKLPLKNYRLPASDKSRIPKNLWFHEDFRFSLISRKDPAPLVFLLAGTGSSYDSAKMILFQRILYEAGYHVIAVSSPFHANFLTAVSSTKLPGLLPEDSLDLYHTLEKAYDLVKNKIKVTDFYVVGYSMGATDAAFLSYIDEEQEKFRFKRVYMINPAVDLYDSAVILDGYLGSGPEAAVRIKLMVEKIKEIAPALLSSEYRTSFSEDDLYALFKDLRLSDEEMKMLIGFVFRMQAIDVNYLTDVLNNVGLYARRPQGKFEKMLPYFKKINYASYVDYLKNILIPVMKKRTNLSETEIRKRLSLNLIADYLKKTDKVVVVTNADELILTKKNHAFLRDVFGKRLVVFPRGGHCGNMFFPDNIRLMLQYLATGVFGAPDLRVGPGKEDLAPAGESASGGFPPGFDPAALDTGRIIDVYDPLEGLNRRIYYFNYGLDKYLLLPVVKVYGFLTPGFVQKGVRNFFANNRMVSVAANSVAQGKIKKAMRAVGRFSMNAVWGLGGTVDTASKMGMPVPYEDFGLTLAYYGVKRGPFLVLPVLGPTTLRDAVGTGTDYLLRATLDPFEGIGVVDGDSKALTLLNAVDTRKRNSFRYYSTGSAFEYDYVRFLIVTYRTIQEEVSKPGKKKK